MRRYLKKSDAFINFTVHASRFTHHVLRFTFCVLLSLLVPACKKQETNPEPRNPTVILISIDTLRADYLKLYDVKGVATPNIEQVANEGAKFQNVITQVPYTLPSHCTMLTGVYPVAHHVRDNVRDILPERNYDSGGNF